MWVGSSAPNPLVVAVRDSTNTIKAHSCLAFWSCFCRAEVEQSLLCGGPLLGSCFSAWVVSAVPFFGGWVGPLLLQDLVLKEKSREFNQDFLPVSRRPVWGGRLRSARSQVLHSFEVVLLYDMDINSASLNGQNGLFILFKDFVLNFLFRIFCPK